MVGLVIGKGTETIKGIAHKSNTKIYVPQKNQANNNQGSNLTRSVEVLGSETEQHIAKELIMELIEGYHNNTLNRQSSEPQM